jgi:hypothetical protein
VNAPDAVAVCVRDNQFFHWPAQGLCCPIEYDLGLRIICRRVDEDRAPVTSNNERIRRNRAETSELGQRFNDPHIGSRGVNTHAMSKVSGCCGHGFSLASHDARQEKEEKQQDENAGNLVPWHYLELYANAAAPTATQRILAQVPSNSRMS